MVLPLALKLQVFPECHLETFKPEGKLDLQQMLFIDRALEKSKQFKEEMLYYLLIEE